MPIEFRCHACQKLLRTPDDKAGAQAVCPQCGVAIVVPFPEPATGPPPFEAAPADAKSDADAWIDSDEPGVESDASALRPCPMCGSMIRARAKRCRMCGETLPGMGAGSMASSLVAGDVLSRAWAIFQAQMGPCIGATVLVMGIFYGLYFAFVFGIQMIVLGAAGGGNGNPQNFLIPVIALSVAAPIFMIAVVSFLKAGWCSYMLRIAKGDKAEIGEIFRGRWWLRMFAADFVAFLLLLLAQALFLGVPIVALAVMEPNEPAAIFGLIGVILAGYFVSMLLTGMFLWPYPFFLIDQDAPGVSCIGRAVSSLSGRRFQSMLVTLACLGLVMAGSMCCLVLIFTAPLAGVILTVAYCDLTGQPTA